MKKNILLTIVLLLTVSLSTFAQKEYNMVITLNNGTTVTLGHNDIKNITFNNGEVSISGDVVTTIEALQNKAAEAKMEMESMKAHLQDMEAKTETDISNLQSYIDKVLAEVQLVDRESQIRDDEQSAAIKTLEYRVKNNQEQIEELYCRIEELRAIIAEMKK